ncbi:MAG TPA: hypothetical protein VF981_09545 [Gemmatimonadaceae bacterium]
MTRWQWAAKTAAALAMLLAAGATASGQTIRVTGSTSARYIQLRLFARDSVPVADAAGTSLLRQLPDGSIVRCIPGEAYCHQVRAGEVLSTVPVIHDLNLSAWGFGRGLRLNSQIRGRSSFGESTDLWPRENEHLEVLALYGEMERGDLRLRAGRQWRVSGLGFYNFDGLAVALRPRPAMWIEAYGGRSLSRGLNEGRTGSALESIENLSAPDAGILFGLQGRYRPSQRVQLGAVYQMDVRADRAGAYSELAAVDGVLRFTRGTAEGSVEFDLAGRALNHASLALRSNPIGNTTYFAEARRYHPYFELWTIWGAFSPVGFDEGRGGVTWATRDGRLMVRAEASYRRYGDAETDAPDDFSTSGWGAGSSLNWAPAPDWRLTGSYRLESGFGAARWDGHAGIRYDVANRGYIAAQAVAFQRLYEFRLGEGTVLGLGGEGAATITERSRAFASIMWYRQQAGAMSAIDWNQLRASLRVEWVLGGEPAGRTMAGARP